MTHGGHNPPEARSGPPAAEPPLAPPPVAPGPSRIIGDDVPCEGCGYNLRGLTPPGRCPECGADLDGSVFAHARRARELARRARELEPPDPRWARQIYEGAWLAVAAFALWLVGVLFPEPWMRLPYRNAALLDAPGRVVLLAVAAGWWTLCWYAAWKLSTQERVVGRPADSAWATAVRCLATANLLVPFGWGLINSRRFELVAPVVLLLLLGGGMFGGLALAGRVAELLRRAGPTSPVTKLAGIVAGFAPASASFALLVMLNNLGPTSLSLMMALPANPYGSPSFLRAFGEGVLDGGGVDAALLVGYAAVAAAWLFRFVLLLSRYRRLAAGATASRPTQADHAAEESGVTR